METKLTPEQAKAIKEKREQIERKALFVPCASKEHLQLWIKRYLGIDMPDTLICDDDETTDPTNSTPMDLVWEIYSKAMDGRDEKFQRVLAYAARDSFKTLSASILEVLCLFHLRRDVAHMAAIESQAQKAASYVAKYLQRPALRDFVKGSNKREITVLRYENANGHILTPDEWDELENEQSNYEPVSNYIKIIIATMAGANSEHVSFMVLDELDLAPEAPVEEAKMIPAPGQVRGELPITFMTSTRKFSFGLVQKEIDNKYKDPQHNHLQIRHWNIIDMTEKCVPERHLPAEPRIPIYYSEKTLKAISEDDWKLLSDEERAQYLKKDGYTGCLRNCSLFAACQGRLATKQKVTDPNAKPRSMLKPIPHIITQFSSISVEHAKAQLLCWKPSSEGLIYPNFQYSKHMLDPVSMYEKITGEDLPRDKYRNFSKADLIQLMINRGMDFHTGMDWGYTHNWAAITGARDGHRFFVVDVIAVPGLETMQKVDMAKSKLGYLSPTIYADPEDPASIKTFSRHGFKMKRFKKAPGSVVGGIEAVRAKILPGLGKEPELFFLAGDEGCELLAQRLSQYHWVVDANQKPTDVPDDKDDDECDALRYIIMNLYGTKGKFVAAVGATGQRSFDPAFPIGDQNNPYTEQYVQQYGRVQEPTVDNWMALKIQEVVGSNPMEQGSYRAKRGGFIVDV